MPTVSEQAVTGLGEGDYYFRVRAVDDDDAASGWSNVESIRYTFVVAPKSVGGEGRTTLPAWLRDFLIPIVRFSINIVVFLIIMMVWVVIAFSLIKYFSRVKYNYKSSLILNTKNSSSNFISTSTEFRDEVDDEERVEILKVLINLEEDKERVEILKALVKLEGI